MELIKMSKIKIKIIFIVFLITTLFNCYYASNRIESCFKRKYNKVLPEMTLEKLVFTNNNNIFNYKTSILKKMKYDEFRKFAKYFVENEDNIENIQQKANYSGIILKYFDWLTNKEYKGTKSSLFHLAIIIELEINYKIYGGEEIIIYNINFIDNKDKIVDEYKYTAKYKNKICNNELSIVLMKLIQYSDNN